MKKPDIKNLIESRRISRRHFLMGGGAALLLPPLLSLLPDRARAQTVTRPKRVILCPTLYGIDPRHFFPVTPPLAQQTMFATSDTPIYTTPLSLLPSPLSTALGAAFADPVIRSRMNIYEGLDVTRGNYIVSHTHGSLAGTAKHTNSAEARTPTYGETIDCTIAKSPNFYKSTPVMPVLRMTTECGGSYWSFDRSATGAIQYESFHKGDKANFDRAFATVGGTAPTNPNQAKLTIVEKNLTGINNLLRSQRLSAQDRQLLDQFATGTQELQRSIQANQAPICSKPNLTMQVTSQGQYYAFPGDYDGMTWGIRSCDALMDNYNQIIVNAFLCDITRIVVIGNEIFQDTPISGYTQQALFHAHDDGTGGGTTTAQKHAWFLNVLVCLAKSLDAVKDPLGNGTETLLDNSVILFTNEHGGVKSHACYSIPTLTIGSAGGSFKTGYYVDCRRRPYTKDNYHESYGRPNKQLLISIMQAMGVQRSEYINNGDGKGFGDFEVDDTYLGYAPYANTHNDPLPWLNV